MIRPHFEAAVRLAQVTVLAFVMTCCTGSSRERHLGYTLSGLIAANSALDAYVPVHEKAITDNCKVMHPDDKAGCEQEVAAFVAKRVKARADINAGFGLVQAAFKLNTDQSVTTAEAALTSVLALLKSIGVSL